MSAPSAATVVDCLGLACPIPVIRLAKAVAAVADLREMAELDAQAVERTGR